MRWHIAFVMSQLKQLLATTEILPHFKTKIFRSRSYARTTPCITHYRGLHEISAILFRHPFIAHFSSSFAQTLHFSQSPLACLPPPSRCLPRNDSVCSSGSSQHPPHDTVYGPSAHFSRTGLPSRICRLVSRTCHGMMDFHGQIKKKKTKAFYLFYDFSNARDVDTGERGEQIMFQRDRFKCSGRLDAILYVNQAR